MNEEVESKRIRGGGRWRKSGEEGDGDDVMEGKRRMREEK